MLLAMAAIAPAMLLWKSTLRSMFARVLAGVALIARFSAPVSSVSCCVALDT